MWKSWDAATCVVYVVLIASPPLSSVSSADAAPNIIVLRYTKGAYGSAAGPLCRFKSDSDEDDDEEASIRGRRRRPTL